MESAEAARFAKKRVSGIALLVRGLSIAALMISQVELEVVHGLHQLQQRQ